MTRRIPLIARDLKRLYTGFLLVAVILFLLCSYLTEFNPMVLAANGDAFWEFITEDFLPPALPKASRIPGIFSSVLVTLALAMSATTVAAILAFFVALFGSEKVSPFPRFAKVVRGFATFLRNIPALVWAFILFSSLGIGTGVGFVALCITSFAFMVRAFVETMEDVSQDCVESLQAVGATFPQTLGDDYIVPMLESGGGPLPPAGVPGHPALLPQRVPLLVPLLRGGQYPGIHHRGYGGRRRCGPDPVLLY